MPKELTAKQFRKGTKSCVECRQRKLRCIPSSDDSSPCQNCQARGRECVSQVHIGRTSETTGVTSRDRIRKLEDSVGNLWAIVRELRTELGHTHPESVHHDGSDPRRQSEVGNRSDADDGGSDESDFSPVNPPTHLQQLFETEFLDARKSDHTTPHTSPGKVSDAVLTRARNRLHAITPPKEDVTVMCSSALTFMGMYNQVFPRFSLFADVNEMLSRYDELRHSDADPVHLAALLIWIAIAVHHANWEDFAGRVTFITDPTQFVHQVSDTVEEVLVTNDTLAGSVEGIETSMLWIRLQLFRSDIKKLWLTLRRFIALAELIGLPRAAYLTDPLETQTSVSSPNSVYPTRRAAAAALWQSICLIDRLVGMMFNLPLGTAAYGYPSPQAIVSGGQVVPQGYLSRLGRVMTMIQDIDNAYASNRPDVELFDKVILADQELQALRSLTPDYWWNLALEKTMPDLLMQYWHMYFTARTHLQLALRNSREPQCAYSHSACTKACRAAAIRYVKLRTLLPPAFFAGRMLDLQAMTVAVFLLYTSYSSSNKYTPDIQDESDQPSVQLVLDIVEVMEAVANRAGGQYARQEAIAIRRMGELLDPSNPLDARSVTLRIPMLGKVNVGRHPGAGSKPPRAVQSNITGPQSTQPQHPQAQYSPTKESETHQSYRTGSFDSQDPLSWSMDLMLEDFPPFPDDIFDADQWLSFNDLNTNGQV